MWNNLVFLIRTRVRTPTPEPIKNEDEDDLSAKDGKSVSDSTLDNKIEDTGEPCKTEKETNGVSLDSVDNSSLKSQKQDKFIYKMPTYEPLQKDSDGKEILLRIPEPITNEVNLEFFNKDKKVCRVCNHKVIISWKSISFPHLLFQFFQ